MNVTNFINSVKVRNPKLFAAKRIQMAPEQLEQQLKNAYSAGFSDGRRAAETGVSLFERVFGK